MTRARRTGIVAGAVVMVVGAFAIFEPSILSSTARSPRAIALLAVIAIGTSVGSRIVTRRWGRRAGRLITATALGLTTGLLVMPALRQTTLNESLPTAATGAATAPAATSATEPHDPPGATSPEPRRLTAGRLQGIGHEASGSVSTFALADGSAVVRFEEVDIRGSPDPVLYLVPGRGKQTREGGTRVGPLKATKGSFNHAVPATFELDQPFTVFIWCERFAVPIANADQQDA